MKLENFLPLISALIAKEIKCYIEIFVNETAQSTMTIDAENEEEAIKKAEAGKYEEIETWDRDVVNIIGGETLNL